jgi:large subunit ribosomal protein L1
MEIEEIKKKIEELRKNSKKRSFVQTFDLIINLKNLDLKKPEHKLDLGVKINSHIKNKKLKICAVVDQSINEAEKIFDNVLHKENLIEMKSDMKEIRKITSKFDKFVVVASLMPTFAQVLGRYLGPLNKMPSPKLGMIINPKTNLQELYNKLQKTVHIQIKKNLVVQASVGNEKETDETIAENIKLVYESLEHHLPDHTNNLKNARLKLSMSKGVIF